MRKPERLYGFYNSVCVLHQELPDWRFMQFISNFLSWHMEKYGSDGFYIEDDEALKRLHEFVDSMFVHSSPQGGNYVK